MSTRRRFLQNSTALASGVWLTAWETLSSQRPEFRIPVDFSLKIMATKWGFNGSWESFCQKIIELGYDGFEVWVPQEDKDRDEMLAAADKSGLVFGLLCGGHDAVFTKHLDQYEIALHKALALKPLYINSHSGRDWFSFAQNRAFIDLSVRLNQGSGVPIYHETHRGRILFAAHIARQYLEAIPGLRLTLDISHWCNVHESLLQDQELTVALALSRSDHIHARIGHAQGPQVNDPRAPEWESTLKRHLEWWDKVVENKTKTGQGLTILTEFGPPNYLPALPYTRQPVADQWEINVHMKDLLRKRYA